MGCIFFAFGLLRSVPALVRKGNACLSLYLRSAGCAGTSSLGTRLYCDSFRSSHGTAHWRHSAIFLQTNHRIPGSENSSVGALPFTILLEALTDLFRSIIAPRETREQWAPLTYSFSPPDLPAISQTKGTRPDSLIHTKVAKGKVNTVVGPHGQKYAPSRHETTRRTLRYSEEYKAR